MSNIDIQILIEINTFSEVSNASIGLVDGVLKWTPYGYDTINPIDGLLHDNYISDLSTAARVSQGGQLAYTTIANIKLNPDTFVYTFLQGLNIQNGNLPVTVSVRSKSPGATRVIHRGVTGTITPSTRDITITVESVTRNRSSDSTYPYYLGENLSVTLQGSTESDQLPFIGGLTPVFFCYLEQYDYVIMAPVMSNITFAEAEQWINDCNQGDGDVWYINGLRMVNPQAIAISLGGVPYGGIKFDFAIGNYSAKDDLGSYNTDFGVIEYSDNYKVSYVIELVRNDYKSDTNSTVLDGIYDSDGNLIDVYSDAFTVSDGVIDYGSEKTLKLSVLDPIGEVIHFTDNEKPSTQEALGLGDTIGMFYQGNGWWKNGGTLESQSSVGLQNVIDGDYATKYNPIAINDEDNTLKFSNAFIIDYPPQSGSKVPLYFTGEIDVRVESSFVRNFSADIYVIGRRALDFDDVVVKFPWGEIEDINTSAVGVSTPFPKLKNLLGGREEWFRYADSISFSNGGLSLDISSGINDVDWSVGFSVVVVATLESFLAGINKAEFLIPSIALVKSADIDIENTTVEVDGRTVNGSVITDTGSSYNLACRLQNLSDLNIEAPAKGWGTQEPTVADWDLYLNQSTSYGGINSVKYDLKGEVTDARKLKSDLAVMMVGLGAVDDSGKESLYSLVDGLFNTHGILIDNSDLFQGSEPIKKAIDQSEIFNEYVVNGVSVINVDSDPSLSPTENYDLWQMGRALYNAYKVKNSYKKDNLLTADGTAKFIKAMLMWFGVNDEFRDVPSMPTNWVVYDRFTLKLTLPLEYAISNHLYVGAKFRYNDYWEGEYSGIITDRIYSPTSRAITITASCTSNTIVSGGDNVIIIETGTSTDTIVETGTNTDIIIEGGR